MIPFNKPFIIGHEIEYIQEAVASGKISGDGIFTKKCHALLEKKYGFAKCLLTTSCTDALEMAAILCNIEPGDEVIAPSYTFVSTVNAFVLRGAKIVFADSEANNPNIDVATLEALVTPKTKAIIVVHYAGIACDMDAVTALTTKHNLFLIEDAAQAIDSYYKGKPLGTFGHFAAFSFHETKNIISGEGGMLVINDLSYVERAEIIREKGTNRSKFFRGEVDKYGWVDIGSSFLPSEIIAAFLYAQLEHLDEIQAKRISLWNLYHEKLAVLEQNQQLGLPDIPAYATNNGHMFYLVCNTASERDALIAYLKGKEILPTFHYLSLHTSPYFNDKVTALPNSDKFTERLVRLPFYYELSEDQLTYITTAILDFYKL
jgi:dTDP-4-amino-4,6-dideoxygalactose transaminase